MAIYQLIRVNPALTSNLELVWTPQQKLYLESINSSPQLNQTKYKHFELDNDKSLAQNYQEFWSGTPPEIAFKVQEMENPDVIISDWQEQWSDLYWAGAQYVLDDWYEQQFEYRAPLWLDDWSELPAAFIVFRGEGHGWWTDDNGQSTTAGKMDPGTLLQQAPIVAYWDLRPGFSPGHAYLDQTYGELNLDQGLYVNWLKQVLNISGFDIDNGNWTSTDISNSKDQSQEQLIYSWEEKLTRSYQDFNLIYPNILNFKFVFDDTVYRNGRPQPYKINRYYGFYVQAVDVRTRFFMYQPSFEVKSSVEPGWWTSDDRFQAPSNWLAYDERRSLVQGYYMWRWQEKGLGNFVKVVNTEDNHYKVIDMDNDTLAQKRLEIYRGQIRIKPRLGLDGQIRNYVFLYNVNTGQYDLSLATSEILAQQVGLKIADVNLEVIDHESYYRGHVPSNWLVGPNRVDWSAILYTEWSADGWYWLRLAAQIERIFGLNTDPAGLLYVNTDGNFSYCGSIMQYILGRPEDYDYYNEYWQLIFERYRWLQRSVDGRISNLDNNTFQSIQKRINELETNNFWLLDLAYTTPLVSPVYASIERLQLTPWADWEVNRVDTPTTDYPYQSRFRVDQYDSFNPWLGTEYNDSQAETILEENDPRYSNFISPEGNTVNLYPIEDNRSLPVSSEYISTKELFQIRNQKLSFIWTKLAPTPKWVMSGSREGVQDQHRLTLSGWQPEISRVSTKPGNIAINQHNLEWGLITWPPTGGDYQFQDRQTQHTGQKWSWWSSNDSSYLTDPLYFSKYFQREYNWLDYSRQDRPWVTKVDLRANFKSGSIAEAPATIYQGIKYQLFKLLDYNIINNQLSNPINLAARDLNHFDLAVIWLWEDSELTIQELTYKDEELNQLRHKLDRNWPGQGPPPSSLPLNEQLKINELGTEIKQSFQRAVNSGQSTQQPLNLQNRADMDIVINLDQKHILLAVRCYKHLIYDNLTNLLHIGGTQDLPWENQPIFDLYQTNRRVSNRSSQQRTSDNSHPNLRYWWRNTETGQLLASWYYKSENGTRRSIVQWNPNNPDFPLDLPDELTEQNSGTSNFLEIMSNVAIACYNCCNNNCDEGCWTSQLLSNFNPCQWQPVLERDLLIELNLITADKIQQALNNFQPLTANSDIRYTIVPENYYNDPANNRLEVYNSRWNWQRYWIRSQQYFNFDPWWFINPDMDVWDRNMPRDRMFEPDPQNQRLPYWLATEPRQELTLQGLNVIWQKMEVKLPQSPHYQNNIDLPFTGLSPEQLPLDQAYLRRGESVAGSWVDNENIPATKVLYRYNGNYQPQLREIVLFPPEQKYGQVWWPRNKQVLVHQPWPGVRNEYVWLQASGGWLRGPYFLNSDGSAYEWTDGLERWPLLVNQNIREGASDFGLTNEIIARKANLTTQGLRLGNTERKSLYPRLDEWGLFVTQRSIWLSNWDAEFYYRFEKRQDWYTL